VVYMLIVHMLESSEWLKCTKLMYQVYLYNLFDGKVITKLPNSEQSYKGKVQTHNYIIIQQVSGIQLLILWLLIIKCNVNF
jgi:hypothetical protein